MAVVKNNKSKKSLVFVDERGFMYVISNSVIRNLMNSGSPHPINLSLMTARANADRFPPSKVFCGGEMLPLDEAYKRGFVDKSFWTSMKGMSEDVFAGDTGKKSRKSRKPLGSVKL